MSPFNEHNASESPLDGIWISVNGALKLELRSGSFTETHRFAYTIYTGRFQLTHNRLILIDIDTGLQTTAVLEPGVIKLRDDTFVRVH